MHFDFLTEDVSGKALLDILLPKILGASCTYRVKSYKGIGKIPKGLTDPDAVRHKMLLDNLPRLLNGLGATHAGQGDFPQAVIVVCDLDRRELMGFLQELNSVLASCRRKPVARFCIAIEEGEAWILGDILAIKEAYPRAKDSVLNSYVNDSICGTWEKLADAVFSGGSRKLAEGGFQRVGEEKSRWAKTIGPSMVVERNQSPSFQFLRRTLLEMSAAN